ncbi:adenylyl-sulfate kinase [Sporichthya brevicatena]|jgi:adenylylsulfate kinase|uniref:Adenylyl-sulfate kinase n=1 Tax=Sporichthya brevicatena TaxID=171442 RepID=A0ABN1H241_9ACTN
MSTSSQQGATIWLTGLSGAGKSTITEALAPRLRAAGHRVDILDGDEVRQVLTADLGFSREDRITNVRRIGYVAEVLSRNGVLTLVPVIAPYAEARDAVRERHEKAGTPFVLIHVATSVEVCAERDVKGLYAKQKAGQMTGLTGVDDPYEEPTNADLRLDTAGRSLDESVDAVWAVLSTRGLI